MAPLPRSSRRNRPSTYPSLSTRELFNDPIHMSDDDPSSDTSPPPQSHVHSVDDAPAPTSHLPSARIFPLPTIDLNRDTDDEQPPSLPPHPNNPPSPLEYFPRKLSDRARFLKKKPTKSRPFAGVDSLLRHASARHAKPTKPVRKSSPSSRNLRSAADPHPQPAQPQSTVARRSQLPHPNHNHNQDKEHSEDELDKDYVMPTHVQRPTTRRQSSRLASVSHILPIEKPRFDRLLRSESDPKEKARFRKLFRSASGKVTLAQIANVVLSGPNDPIPSSENDVPVPRKSRRLNNQPSVQSKLSEEVLSEQSYDHVEVLEEVEVDDDDDDNVVTNTGSKRGHPKDQGGRASDRIQASVPLPKTKNTLAHRVKARLARLANTRKDNDVQASRKKAAHKVSKKRKNGEMNKQTPTGVRKSKRAAARRGRRKKNWELEEEEEDSDFLSEPAKDEEVAIDEGTGVESSASADEYEEDEDEEEPKILRTRRGGERGVNKRRKRTRPADAFNSGLEELSAQKQKERLDQLLKQSADISRELHRAMAEATANQNAPAGSKSPATGGVARGSGELKEGGAGDDVTLDAAEGQNDGNGGLVQSRKEEELVPPMGKNTELQPHQIDGVKWLLTLDAQGINAILADEMGLGKTIQAVTFLASLVLSGSRGPHLVIAPKNVCDHWAKEVCLFYPGKINVVTHLGSCEERFEELEAILDEDNFDIMVTSYEVALRDLFKKQIEGGMRHYRGVLRKFRNVEFEYLVVDEAHRLKNDDSKLNLGIRGYKHAQRRLLLTGTPLSNDLKELWSLMNVLNPRIFSSKATFKTWFAAPFDPRQGSRSAKNRLTHAEQSVIVDRLHTIIRPFFRRRVRADVCPSYTSADEVVIRCPMSQLQKALMLHFRRRADVKNNCSAHNIIMSMRMVSSHPFTVSDCMFNAAERQANLRLVASSGKFEFLHYSLPRLIAAEHRVLIFSQFRRTLDFLEDLMDLLGVKYGRLDGLTASEDRLRTISEFNSPQSELKVFLLTTRAGGVGINLQTADTVILFDSDWNPSADLQAVSRIQRIGQKKTVHIIRLLTDKSADEHIYDKQRHKLRTQAVAVGAGKFNTSNGAALDQSVRQKDLEKVLQDLDINNYMPTGLDQELIRSAPNEIPSTDNVASETQACPKPSPDVGSCPISKEEPPAALAEGTSSVNRGTAPILNATTARARPDEVEKVVCSAPSQQAVDARVSRAKEWDRLLLRQGETSLPDISHDAIWVDSVDENGPMRIPIWLNKDANLQAARRALESRDPSTAAYIYEETLQSIMRDGAFSKKERAQRARRNVIQDFGSELGSESEGGESISEDPNAVIPSLEDISDDDYSASEESSGRRRKKRKVDHGARKVPIEEMQVSASPTTASVNNIMNKNVRAGSSAPPGSYSTANTACMGHVSSQVRVAPQSKLVPILPNMIPGGIVGMNPGLYPHWQQLSRVGVNVPAQVGSKSILETNPQNAARLRLLAPSLCATSKHVSAGSASTQPLQLGNQNVQPVQIGHPIMQSMHMSHPNLQCVRVGNRNVHSPHMRNANVPVAQMKVATVNGEPRGIPIAAMTSNLHGSLSPSIIQPGQRPLPVVPRTDQEAVRHGAAQNPNEGPSRNHHPTRKVVTGNGRSPASDNMVSSAVPQAFPLLTPMKPLSGEEAGVGVNPSARGSQSRVVALGSPPSVKQISSHPNENDGSRSPSGTESTSKRLRLGRNLSGRTKQSAIVVGPSSIPVEECGSRSCAIPAARMIERNEQGQIVQVNGSSADLENAEECRNLGRSCTGNGRQADSRKETMLPSGRLDALVARIASSKLAKQATRRASAPSPSSTATFNKRMKNSDKTGSHHASTSNAVSSSESGPSQAGTNQTPSDQTRTAQVAGSSKPTGVTERKDGKVIVDLTESTDSESETWGDCVLVEPRKQSAPQFRTFPALVEQLRQLTEIRDTDTLIDALLATGWDVKAADELIKSRR